MSRKILRYSSIGNTVDGTNYCSGVETLADNLMEDNEDDAVVVFPSKDGFGIPKTSVYTLTTGNCEIHLPLPIYKIVRVLFYPKGVKYYGYDYTSYTWHVFESDENGDYWTNTGENFPQYLDVTDSFVTETEWKALKRASSDVDALYNRRQENTFTYEIGASKISIPDTTRKFGFSFVNGMPAYERFVWHNFYKVLIDKGAYAMLNTGLVTEYKGDYLYEFEPGMFKRIEGNNVDDVGITRDPRDWLFRIEYVPMTSKTKLRARKNAPTMVDYIQPYNQRAEINAVSALGKNMYLTAQKTSVREITIVKNYTKLADIPPLGALVRHNGKRYRLVANTYKQTNTIFVQVTHTLSENWTSRSKHIAVDQKYRNWKIPQDTLWRNLYWEDYVLISPEINDDVMDQEEGEKASMALSYIMQAFTVDNSADETVDTMYFIKGAYDGMLQGVYTPCSTMSIGNSIVFAGAMQDNLSAGLRRKRTDINLCEEALYCNEDGTLENMCVILSAGVKGGIFNAKNGVTTDATAVSEDGTTHAESLYAANMVLYPTVGSLCLYDGAETPYLYTINAPAKVLMHNDFHVDKDPGEALKFTYQIHFVSDGGIIVGSKLAEHNPLIKQWKTNRKFRLWLCTKFIRDFADLYVPNAQDRFYDTSPPDPDYPEYENEPPFVCEQYVDKADKKHENVYEIGFFSDYGYALRNNDKFVAWCITDENNNIYLACNDKKINQVFFQMTHKRVQK